MRFRGDGVRLTEAGAKGARYAPSSRRIGATVQGLGGGLPSDPTETAWDRRAAGLARHGGVLVPMPVTFGEPNRLRLRTLAGWTEHPTKGTPGVVWESEEQVVFVTVDGGRYELSIPNEDVDLFDKGAGAPATWPAPLEHTLLDVDALRALGRAGIGQAEATAIEAADDAWWSCVNGAWKKAQRRLDENEAASASADLKAGRASGIVKSAELDAPKQCAPTKRALEERLVKSIDERTTARRAIFDAVRARF